MARWADHEVEFLKLAKERGFVTIGLAFDEKDSCVLVGEAVLEGVSARLTAGGLLEAVRAEGRFAHVGS